MQGSEILANLAFFRFSKGVNVNVEIKCNRSVSVDHDQPCRTQYLILVYTMKLESDPLQRSFINYETFQVFCIGVYLFAVMKIFCDSLYS